MAVIVNGSEITLSGTVGDYWFEEGFTSGEVVAALAQVGDAADIVVRINSGGGIATEGAAIHAILARHKGKKTVVVEGIAASSASLIAMAGDEIEMAIGSTMMIHDPSAITFGTAADHEVSLRALNAMADAFAGVYAARSGRSEAQARADMKAELWLTPEAAVEHGYATRVGPASANDNEPDEQAIAAFDYRIYAHAPQPLVALAKTNGWRMSASRTEAASAAPTRQKEIQMANDKPGAITPEDIESARAAATEAATKAAMKMATDIANICAEHGAPASMAATLLAEGVTLDQARTRASQAKEITAAVEMANKSGLKLESDFASKAIASGKSLDAVRGELFAKMTAAQSPEISSHHQPAGNHAAATATASMKRQLERAGQSKGA